MTVLAVMPGKAPERMELDGSLEAMQKFVGGTIQAVYPSSDPVAIVCNDEGKLMGLERNRALRDDSGNVYDILYGPFFVCGLGYNDFIGLTDEQIEKYTKLFWEPEMFIPTPNGMVVLRISD